MSDFYEVLRQSIINGNEEESKEILRSLVSPSDVKAQQDGALFNIIVRGLSIFNYSSVVKDAGIADDDPRAKKFNTVHGYLIDKHYVNRLQNISAKKDRIAVAAGGIPVMNRNKYLYWVPNKGIGQFKLEMDALQNEYRGVVQEIYDNYTVIRDKARKITKESAEEVWAQLAKDPKFSYTKDQYVNEALNRFDNDFVKQNELFSKISVEVLLSDKPFHPRLAEILGAVAGKERDDNEIVTDFFELLERQTDNAEEIKKLKESFQSDSALSMSSKVDVEIMKNIGEITNCLETLKEGSQKVSKRRLKSLYDRIALHRGNRASLDKVIRMTNSMINGSVTQDGVDELNRLVLLTLREVESEIDLEGCAAAIAKQAQNGEAREALDQLQELEAGLESRLLMAKAMKSKVMSYYNAEIVD